MQGGHKVIHADRRADQLLGGHLHQAHVLALRVRWERRDQPSFGRWLKPFGCLAPSDGHHKGLVDNDGDI